MIYTFNKNNIAAADAVSGPKFTWYDIDKIHVYTGADIPEDQPAESEDRISLRKFGIVDSAALDQTEKLKTALAEATAGGFAIDVPPGRVNYDGLIGGIGCSIYGIKGLSKIYAMTPTGRNTRWDWASGVSDITVSGLSFVVPNKPVAPSNNATEPDGILRFTGGSNVHVVDCDFIDPFGTPIMFRSINYGSMLRCRSIGAWKDSFHITGLSRFITRKSCLVINGGDDAFPIVGYYSNGTVGQPEDIADEDCHVRGVKFARAFAYVGAKRVRNINCTADGAIPAEYPQAAADGKKYGALAGLYIASEGSFDTFGNEDIYVENIFIRNCGKRSPFNNAVTNAIHVYGRADRITRNINISGIVEDTVTKGLFANGQVVHGIDGLNVDLKIRRTNDPGGVVSAPGAGNADAVEVQNCRNPVINAQIEDIGGGGVIVTNTCTGKVNVDVTSSRVNTSGAAAKDIVLIQSSSQASDIDVSVHIEEQETQATAGLPHYLDKIVENNNPGRTRRIHIDGVGLDRGCQCSVAHQAIAIGASPAAWQNDQPYPVLVRIQGGTGIEIQHALTQGISSPAWSAASTAKTCGYFPVQPGESIKIKYTTAPTCTWIPTKL